MKISGLFLFVVINWSFSGSVYGETIGDFESSVLQLLSDGRQSEAENLVKNASDDIKKYQRYELINACLVRSRFDIPGATKLFNNVILDYPYDEDGYLAFLTRELDSRGYQKEIWYELRKLADKSQLGIWPKWMAGVEARNLKLDGEGKQIYEGLLDSQKVGSSLMHQTFANILDELGLHMEALVHRRLAVSLEDRSWSRDGLAHTLGIVGLPNDATANYEEAIRFSPQDVRLRINYAIFFQTQKKFEEAIEILNEAAKILPDSDKVWYNLGLCSQSLGKIDEARQFFQKAIELNSGNSLATSSLAGLN